MPVRSSNSSVLKWPDARSVDRAVRLWAGLVAQERDDVLRIGYFGSYASGDWGVGSDLDLVVVIEESAERFVGRAAQWDTTSLPVPADLLVYTDTEWRSIEASSRFGQVLATATRWVYARDAPTVPPTPPS